MDAWVDRRWMVQRWIDQRARVRIEKAFDIENKKNNNNIIDDINNKINNDININGKTASRFLTERQRRRPITPTTKKDNLIIFMQLRLSLYRLQPLRVLY